VGVKWGRKEDNFFYGAKTRNLLERNFLRSNKELGPTTIFSHFTVAEPESPGDSLSAKVTSRSIASSCGFVYLLMYWILKHYVSSRTDYFV
jgi:hypothetical protein